MVAHDPCTVEERVRIPYAPPISEHSINRNTEVDLASRVPLTALITGALARALRMVLHAPAELATQCGAIILNGHRAS